MDVDFEFDIISPTTNNPLLHLFTTFVDQDISELLSDAEECDDFIDDEAIDAFKWKCKLQMAATALLKSLDNVNYTDSTGQTFLHHFIEIFLNESRRLKGDRLAVGLEIVKNLLDRGASVFITDDEGLSPLQIVMNNGHTEIMELILKKLKNISLCYVKNCPDKHLMNTSPSHLDVGDYALEVMEICLENEVDFDVHTDNHETLVIIVCKYSFHWLRSVLNKIKVISLLIERGCNVNAIDLTGYSALHYAAEKQGAEVVKRLIDLGAEVDQLSNDNITPIRLAVRAENLSIVEVLLHAGADVNAEVADKIVSMMFDTIARWKFKFGNSEIGSRRAQRDVNPWHEILGFKPLHILALNSGIQSLDLIVEEESEIHCPTKCGWTILHLASLGANFEVVDILIQRGVDANCREPHFGLTPLHLVCMTKEQFYMLIEERDNTSASLTSAARFIYKNLTTSDRQHRLYIIDLLAQNGSDINIKDFRGMTPLHYVTLQSPIGLEDLDVLPTLLDFNARINIHAYDGQLPLRNVIQQHDIAALGYLMSYGADTRHFEPLIFDKSWIPATFYPVDWTVLHDRCNVLNAFHIMLKLKIAGLLTLDLSNLDEIGWNSETYKEYYDDYIQEVKKLKKYLIDGDISLYDWLSMNHMKARPFYLNVVPLKMISEFPVYYEIIEARYHMVTERVSLMEPAKLAWYKSTKIRLPEECLEHILFFLSNTSLQLLAASLDAKII